VSTFTDANHNTWQLGYDLNGNRNLVIDPLNGTRRYLYDAMGRVTKFTDPDQNATQYSYDDLGRLKTKTDALQNATAYSYDDNGNKTSETDGNHHTTTYQYDALNRVSAILYPDNTSKSFTYDFRGNKLTEVDQLGRTTKYVYDLAGQLTSVTTAYGTPDAGTATYTYDADGRKKTVTDELNHTTTYNYDDAGRQTSVQDALTNTTSYGYDSDNRQTSVTDANTHTTNYAYDARGRLVTTTYPIIPPATHATSSLATYDGVGRLLAATDQAGNPTTRGYDLVGRLTSVTDALHNITRYGYDPAANLTSMQDAAGRTTAYQYDVVNRRSTRKLPLQQLETYTYDAVGNLATKTDFKLKKTTYNYDSLNRLLSKVPDSSLNQPTVSFTYTATGQRASMGDASGATAYSYDNRDRLLSNATPEGTLSYTYDAHGNVLTIVSSNANGASATYAYDALNRLSGATDNRIVAQGAASGKTSYSYDPVGNILGYTYPNTVHMASAFDPLNRLTQTSSSNSGNMLASYTYSLNPVGMRLSAAEQSARTATYGYDNDYRLTSEAIAGDPGGGNGTVNYTYDVIGNRSQQTSTLSGITGGSFSYDANDRLTTDAYDNNGNTIASGGSTYAYDFENRLLASGGLGLTYDGEGNRVGETVAGATTQYLVDTLNPTGLPQVVDEIQNGAVTRTYTYGLQRISENQIISGAWTPSFYGYDSHGSVRFLTNTAGAVTDTYQYDAFGNQIASTGATPNSYFYSGERFDSGLGFYDLRARYYRQSTGRFWTRDPIEGKLCCGLSWNPYLYVKDNAVNRIDPTGRVDLFEYSYRLPGQILAVTGLVSLVGAELADLFCDIKEALESVPQQPSYPPLPPLGASASPPTIGPPHPSPAPTVGAPGRACISW